MPNTNSNLGVEMESKTRTKNKVKLNQSFFSNPLNESIKPKTVAREL